MKRTNKKRVFRHLTYADRIKLEALLRAGISVKQIAMQLHFSTVAIYLEIKKGQYEALNYNYTTEYRYSCDLGQAAADEVLSCKGSGLKIGNRKDVADRIEYLIIHDKYSPEVACRKLKEEFPDFSICPATLYSYIHKDIFLNLSCGDLPHPVKKKKQGHVIRQKRAAAGELIVNRPESVNNREEFGHWEMDTVVGSQGDSKKVLLVLTERKTRKEIIRIMPNRKARTVVKTLNQLERKLGIRTFRKLFKTITVDNGVEFTDYQGLMLSIDKHSQRTQVYYCHPYSSWERGSNENCNRLIRRHIPKGTNFDDRTASGIQKIEEWINNYPRRILGWKTAGEAFREEMQLLLE